VEKLLENARILVHWLVTIFIIVYIFTGLGITNYQIVEAATFGALSKLGAYQLHTALLIPFVLLLALHIMLSFLQNRRKRNINVA
jgi:Ni,Fe-hydrogenase I cytochrome b subunit